MQLPPDKLAEYDQMASATNEALTDLVDRLRGLVADGAQRETAVTGLAAYLHDLAASNPRVLAGLAAIAIDRIERAGA